jgi:membrane-associated phospholipid phosphatase
VCSKQIDSLEITKSEKEPTAEAVPRPETWGQHVAHWVSQAGSPPVMGLLAFFLILTRLSSPRLWVWTGMYIVLTLIAPLGFLLWQLRRGHVTDLDVHFRQQRTWSFAVTCSGFLLAWSTMLISGAPPVLLLIVGTGLLQWLTLSLITLRWKISVHAASVTGATLFLVWGFGFAATPVAVAVPLVAWSRVKLRRHTPAQVAAGILLGCVAFYIALLLTPSLRVPGILTP